MKKLIIILSLLTFTLFPALGDQDVGANFASQSTGDGFQITPSDSTDLQRVTLRGIYIGVAGNISLVTAGDANSITVAVPVGILPIQVRRVLATGTTASGLVGLY